ncbi:MAG: 5-(carboxyamino)imidazole ribonucleotide mutase [Acidimicrobiia bacterium]
MAEGPPAVVVIVGSESDSEQIGPCLETLAHLGIAYEARILSAHRTPHALAEYTERLEERGVRVVIAAAGMAAHLAGMVAAHTTLPVVGVPIASGPLGGIDSLLATAQMPPGVPVATVAIGKPGAANAALLAARILALSDHGLKGRLQARLGEKRDQVLQSTLPAPDCEQPRPTIG